jgi:hypothetical protein
MFDSHGVSTHNFWEATSTNGYQLPALATFDPSASAYDSNRVVRYFPNAPSPTLPEMPDRVTLRVRLQPVGLDVIEDLVASGDLSPEAGLAQAPTFDIALHGPPALNDAGQPDPGLLEWTASAGGGGYSNPSNPGDVTTCVGTNGFTPGTPVVASSAATCAPR